MPPEDRLTALRQLAWPLAVLSFVVMALSIYLRLDYAGLGCADWPACYAQALADPATRPATGLARLLHRLTATVALLLAIAIVWKARRPTPVQPVSYYSTLLLALMLFLSVIGIASSDPHWVIINFLNILGGLGLVSFSCRTYMATCPMPATASHIDLSSRLLKVGLTCLTATLILGCLIGARYAANACLTLPHCQGAWWPTPDGAAALNPFTRLTGPSVIGDMGGVTLHLLHRTLAILSVLLIAVGCLPSLRAPQTRPGSMQILALLGLTLLLGFATVASGFSIWLAIAHGLCAAALLVAIARHQVSLRQARIGA